MECWNGEGNMELGKQHEGKRLRKTTNGGYNLIRSLNLSNTALRQRSTLLPYFQLVRPTGCQTGESQVEKRHAMPCALTNMRLKLRFQPSLFAQLVCSYPVECSMTFYRNCFYSVCVDRMIRSFAEKIKTVVLKIFDNISAFNGHCQSQPSLARINLLLRGVPVRFVHTRGSFHGGRLLKIDDNLQKISLQLQLRAIQSIDPCTLIGVWYISQYSF